jgi:hypothetical protein
VIDVGGGKGRYERALPFRSQPLAMRTARGSSKCQHATDGMKARSMLIDVELNGAGGTKAGAKLAAVRYGGFERAR